MTYKPLDRDKPVLVLGAGGMVGSAVMRKLDEAGFTHIEWVQGRREVDLRYADHIVAKGYADKRWQAVFNCAAVVGGISANMRKPYTFLHDNLLITLNVLRCLWQPGTRIIQFGSSCMYPRNCRQPMVESDLLTGPLESTNEAYAIAKLTTMMLGKAHAVEHELKEAEILTLIPPNLYGPGDNYDPDTSHVVAAMIRRFHKAKENGDTLAVCWGTGRPRREFMHVDDLASAALHVAENYQSHEPVNVGTGHAVSISLLACMVADAVGYTGVISFNGDHRIDGTNEKVMASWYAQTRFGWRPKIRLREGLERTYAAYLEESAHAGS